MLLVHDLPLTGLYSVEKLECRQAFHFIHGVTGSDARAGASLLGRNWGWFAVRGVLALLLGVQISLGVLSIVLPLNPHVRTIHLVVGAALFSTVCAHAALVHRAKSFEA